MKNEEVNKLLDKYLAEQASVEELNLVDEWYQSFEKNAGIIEQLSEEEREQTMNEGFMKIRNRLNL